MSAPIAAYVTGQKARTDDACPAPSAKLPLTVAMLISGAGRDFWTDTYWKAHPAYLWTTSRSSGRM